MKKGGEILTPLERTSKKFYILIGILVVVIAWFFYALYTQFTLGLAATGLMEFPAGSPWGIYIANFVYFTGIATAGGAILGMVYVLKWDKYRPLVRISVAVTCIFLVLGMLSVVLDLGRPDRMLNLFLYGRASSPFLWDLVLVLSYLALGLIAAYLILRTDLPPLAGKVSKWRQRIYRLLGVKRHGAGRDRALTEKMMKWVSVGMIFAVLSHALVTQYVFGTMVGRPGWYNPFFGAYSFLASIATGLAVVIVIAAVLRFFYGWKEHLKLEIFTGLGKLLLVLNLIYLALLFSEQLTWSFMGTTVELELSKEWLFGAHAPFFWSSVVMLITSIPLIAKRTVGSVFVASALVLGAYWIKRIIVISGAFLHSLLPYPSGMYSPTWVEWSITAGAVAVGVLALTLIIKIFPLMEFPTKAPPKVLKRPKIMNNWLVLGAILLVLSGASFLVGLVGLALPALLTGFMTFLLGSYVVWFTSRAKLGK